MSNDIEILRMPKLGMSMTEGKVTEWYFQEGDQVDEGDEILEVSTEKISNGVCCNHDGVLRRILVALDETVKVETPVAIIAPGNITHEEIDKVLSSNG